MAIHGVGGLGHLGIQFAARQGFRTVAVNRGRDKEALARSLGATDYIDSTAEDPAKALLAMGGAKAIIATVTSGEAMQAIAGGIGVNGTMMVIGAVGPLTVDSFDLSVETGLGARLVLGRCNGLRGHAAVQRGPCSQFDERDLPLDQAQAAYDRMMSGEARFRVVLDMGAD